MKNLFLSLIAFSFLFSGPLFANDCVERMKVERKESAKLAAVSFPLLMVSDPTVIVEGSRAANYKRMIGLIKEAEMGKIGRYTKKALKKVKWQVSAPELHQWTLEKLNMGLFCNEKMPWNFLNWRKFMRTNLDEQRMAQGLEPLWKK